MAVPGVLTAAVALAGAGRPAAQRVAVFGADEAPSGVKDAWATSEGAVFRNAPHRALLCLCSRLTYAGPCFCGMPQSMPACVFSSQGYRPAGVQVRAAC